MGQRFFFGFDNSGHEYLVPAEFRGAWNAWIDIPEDDERSWDVPAFAQRIDGASNYTFTDPQENSVAES